LLNKYLVLSSKEFGERMRTKVSLNIGQKSPNWLLPLVSGDSTQLTDLKSSLVLLEFWFPYCGGCVKAIPEINNIYDTYQSKNLKVFGIEFTRNDPKELDDYIIKQGIRYPTLFKGQEVAIDYGVNAAPTFFLINKKGFIVYSSVGLNRDDLIKSINDNI
jgi:thiol-disulfide isomerase/thioredoxin